MDRSVWALRRWWWAVTAAAVAVMVAVAWRGDDQRASYEARALVVAQRLTMHVDQLPGYLASVSASGTVEERLETAFGVGDLIPTKVRVEPVIGTIAARVVGIDADASTAASLANTASEILVDALNAGGPGVGIFAVQDPARPPGAPATDTSSATFVVGAGAAAALVALGCVTLWAALRRPVTNDSEAAALLGTAPLGTIDLAPARKGMSRVDPLRIVGLDALTRRLVPGPGTTAVVTSPRDARYGEVLSGLLAGVASTRGPTQATAAADGSPVVAAPGAAIVVALRTDVDVPQVVSPGARVAVVVLEGTPATEVAELATPFAEGELSGAILVRRPWIGRRLLDRLGK